MERCTIQTQITWPSLFAPWVLVGRLQLEPLLLLFLLGVDRLRALSLEPALPAGHADATGGAHSGDDERRGNGDLAPSAMMIGRGTYTSPLGGNLLVVFWASIAGLYTEYVVLNHI